MQTANSETPRCRLPLKRKAFCREVYCPSRGRTVVRGWEGGVPTPAAPHPEATQRPHAPAAPIPRRGRAPRPAGTAPTRRPRRAEICGAPGVGSGPGVRQAGPSRALPRGVGSHSHPWAASPGPVPARPQPLSAPMRAASPGPGAERPRRRHQLPSAPGAGPACQSSGKPLAAAAATPFGFSSSLLPPAHTTPTLGSQEACRHRRRLRPLPGHPVFSVPQATLARLGSPICVGVSLFSGGRFTAD